VKPKANNVFVKRFMVVSFLFLVLISHRRRRQLRWKSVSHRVDAALWFDRGKAKAPLKRNLT